MVLWSLGFDYKPVKPLKLTANRAPEGLDSHATRIYTDDVFIGNISSRMPILQLKRGKHVIKVELEEAEAYTEPITILGEPNHQVLNVAMKRKAKT